MQLMIESLQMNYYEYNEAIRSINQPSCVALLTLLYGSTAINQFRWVDNLQIKGACPRCCRYLAEWIPLTIDVTAETVACPACTTPPQRIDPRQLRRFSRAPAWLPPRK